MATQDIVLAKLNIDTAGVQKSVAQLEQTTVRLRAEMQTLTEAGKETTAEYTRLEAELQRTATIMNVQNAALGALADTSGNAAAQQQAFMGALQQAGGAVEAQGKTFSDYRQQVADSFASINVFNGGLGGLISRMQEAGGAGPLLANAFGGITGGITGMTKAAWAFVANPIGVAIAAIGAALGAVISYFRDTQEGIDAVTSVTRPLQAVFSAIMSVFQQVGKVLVDVFTSPKKSMEELYEFVKQNLINRFTAFAEILEGIMTLDFKKVGNGILQATTGVEDVMGKTQKAALATGQFFDEAIKKGQRIDELQKQLDRGQADYTKRMSELNVALDEQNSIASDANATDAERQAAAEKAITLAKEQNKLALERMDTQIELLRLKLSENGFTNAEKQELAELVAKRKEAAAEYEKTEKGMYDKLNGIRQDAHDKELARRQKLLDDAIEKQRQTLNLYVAENDMRSKTLDQQLEYENEYAKQSIAILRKQLDLKKISWLEYKTEVTKIETQRNENIARIQTTFAKLALDIEMAKTKSTLEQGQKITEATLIAEKSRLKSLKDQALETLKIGKALTEKELDLTDDQLRAGSQKLQEYYLEKLKIENEYQAQVAANQEAFNKQQDDDKKLRTERETEVAAYRKQADFELNNTEYQQKVTLEQERHDTEVAQLQQWRNEELLSKAEFDRYKAALDEEHSRNKQRLAIQNMQTELGTMQNVANALTEAFGQSKELAIAQATMNAGQAILSIWSGTISGNPLVDSIIKGVLSASTAVKTAKQIKEIQSAKKPNKPKFAQGGLMPIGGNRHSNGGTLFTGTDGTQFEAEQGELIGVMNRNAARHFMAFNNAFLVGNTIAPNYFANGGIVSREIAQQTVNIDELAIKLAEANRALPSPVVAIEDIISQGNSYVQVRNSANF